MIKDLFKQLWKDKFARIALFLLGIIYFALFFADFLAPYTKDFSDRSMAYVPPSKIFTIDENGKLSKPYTYNYKREFDPVELKIVYTLDRSQKHYIKFFAKGQPYKFLGLIPMKRHLITTDSEGRLFLLGTDINGRDVFSRILFGGRISMTIGFLALFVLFPIGLLYGGIAGYFGGKVDMIMMRFAEAVMSIPSFYLLIILASILPSGMTSVQRFMLIVVILALIGWASFARVVRGMVLSIKNQEYVQAAKSIGAPVVELHTGAYANSWGDLPKRQRELERLRRASERARELGITVNSGHGINYQNASPLLEAAAFNELNIGHSIICRALVVGIEKAVSEMKALINAR